MGGHDLGGNLGVGVGSGRIRTESRGSRPRSGSRVARSESRARSDEVGGRPGITLRVVTGVSCYTTSQSEHMESIEVIVAVPGAEAGVPAGLSVVCALLVTFGLALWLLPFLSPPLACREKVPMTSWGELLWATAWSD